MENVNETSPDVLKDSFASIPFKIVNYSGRFLLSHNLDVKSPLPARNGNARDYRGLAELMGFKFNDIKRFERYNEPTMKILESWETQPDATLDKLIGFLEEIDRHDVVNELIPMLERDVKSYNQRLDSELYLQNIPVQVDEITSCPENACYKDNHQIITCDDVRTGECTSYDAYVCYAEEDTEFVEELANRLEPPGNKFKLCIHGRDILPGGADIEAKTNLIKQRCRLMLIILSPNFLRSPACAFQTSFAASLAIDERKRMLIPLIVSPCEIPPLLKYLSRLDFTNPYGRGWLWNKLVISLCRMRQNKITVEPTNTYESVTNKEEPTITFPETRKHEIRSADNSIAAIEDSPSVTSVKVIEERLENPVPKNESPSVRKRLVSSFKNKFGSSSASSTSRSFFSGASSNTSGFHSQSDNIESSVNSV